MARFCGKCGAKLDEQTGFCPNCDAAQLARSKANQSVNLADGDVQKERPISRKEKRKQKKLEKKAAKKEKKRQKRAAMTFGQKVRKFFLKLLLVLLLLVVLTVSAAGVLVYFDLVEIPLISCVLVENGLKEREIPRRNPQTDPYVPEEDTISIDEEKNVVYANDEIIVIFSEGTTDAQKNEVIAYLEGEQVGAVPALNLHQIKIKRSGTIEELDRMAKEIKAEFDSVMYATYDTAEANATEAYCPNDPWGWGVNADDWKDDDVDGLNWGLEAIDAQNAWSYKDQLSEIVVGVCDSSFDVGHEDLKNRVAFPNELLESTNVTTPWWTDFDNWKHLSKWGVEDQPNYHGTHVAGIIGAEGDNEKGMTGIVPKCKMLLAPVCVDETMEGNKAWDSSVYANLAYLVEAGAKVINFSLGKTNYLSKSVPEYSKEFLEREGNLAAVSMAKLLEKNHDFIVVQSAGNGKDHDDNPETASVAVDAIQNGRFASITNNSITASETVTIEDVRKRVIIVGAAKNNKPGFECVYYSNFGPQVDLCAPGVDIYSTIPGNPLGLEFSGGYGEEEGTSMAAPMVTGVCALTWSANPTLSGEKVKQIVCTNYNVKVEPSPSSNSDQSYPMVNAKLSVEAALALKEKGDADNGISLDKPQYMPIDAVEFNGHYYYLYDLDTVTGWAAAQQYCQEQGGHLATITSAEEDAFLYSYMRQKGCDSAMFGLTDQDADDDWKWVTGEEFSYYNWHTGEPNHQGGYEHYGMYYREMTDGTWNDGDGRDGPFLCEWEDASARRPIPTASKERDIVLVLDGSGSMGGTPIEETQKAANKFVDTILGEHANVGMVVYDDDVRDSVNISADPYPLKEALTDLSAGGGTNIEEGLVYAKQMLDSGQAKKKIIVLMSDGAPTTGKTDDELVAYANSLKKEGILIYTIGFFGSNTGSASYEQQLMEHIASEGCHYEVANADELVYFFEDIGDQISGQKYIYVRIACPVDVSVRHNGQVLNSAAEKLSTRTKFGTLTLENQVDGDENNQIKVLRLKEGADYHVEIVGTGRGLMNYTIGFMDEDGEYSDFRKFENIRVTKRTVVDTVAAVKKESTLNIDEDGDGKYDIRLKAGANEYGEEVKSVAAVYIAIASVVLLIILIRFVVIKINGKQKEKEKK